MCSLYARMLLSKQYFIVATASKAFLRSLRTAFHPEYYRERPRNGGGRAGVAPKCLTIFVMLVAVYPVRNKNSMDFRVVCVVTNTDCTALRCTSVTFINSLETILEQQTISNYTHQHMHIYIYNLRSLNLH